MSLRDLTLGWASKLGKFCSGVQAGQVSFGRQSWASFVRASKLGKFRSGVKAGQVSFNFNEFVSACDSAGMLNVKGLLKQSLISVVRDVYRDYHGCEEVDKLRTVVTQCVIKLEQIGGGWL